MFFHFFAWFLNDLFDWNSVWPGFGITALLLFILAAIAGYVAYRLFQANRATHPRHGDRAGEATRAELEAQTIERDQVKRSLDKAEEVKPGG